MLYVYIIYIVCIQFIKIFTKQLKLFACHLVFISRLIQMFVIYVNPLIRVINKKSSIYNKMVRKCYLEAKFQNSEGTLFSPIFKVEENKVPSEY